METNEIEKNTITATNAENAQIKVNSQPSVEMAETKNENKVSQDTLDINSQKTQRIEILSELIRDTETSQKINTEAKLNSGSRAELAASNKNGINGVKTTNKVSEEAKTQHSQDKKDYRLEKILLDRINAMQGKIKESLELIKKFERINAKEENLPNIVITLRDKLTQEVIKQFRTVGIEFNMKSYLVQSVVSDLLAKFEEGITEFKECSENLNFVKEVQDDFESRVGLVSTSKVKNLFARLRGLIKPERKQERLFDLERTRQEKKLEEANIHLIKYKYKNSELAKYTIRKNLVESLTREMIHGKGSNSNASVAEFIEKRISPEMEKLGLQYLEDSLEESLYKEYSENHQVESKDAFMKLTMNTIHGNHIKDEYESARSKIIMTTSNNKNVEQEEAREAI